MPDFDVSRYRRRGFRAGRGFTVTPQKPSLPSTQGALPIQPDAVKVTYWMPVVHRTFAGTGIRARDMARRALTQEAKDFHHCIWQWDNGSLWAWPDHPFSIREVPVTDPEEQAKGHRRLIAFPSGMDPGHHFTFSMTEPLRGRRLVLKTQEPTPPPSTLPDGTPVSGMDEPVVYQDPAPPPEPTPQASEGALKAIEDLQAKRVQASEQPVSEPLP